MSARRNATARRRLARMVTVVAATALGCTTAGAAAYAGVDPVRVYTGGIDASVEPSFTVYVDEAGLATGTVSAASVGAHEAGGPAVGAVDYGVDTARDDGSGGSAVCTPYLTTPHATPRSPRDGDIYVEGDVHLECASSRVDADFTVGIEWRLEYGVEGSEGSSGTRLQHGPSASCSQSSRCPRSGDVIAPWGHISACWETGRYYATTVIVSGYYWYRGHRYDFGGSRSGTISGTYGKGC